MSDPDHNVNVYRHQWSAEARAIYGYPKESKKETVERLSRATSDAGVKEYQRLTKQKGSK